MPKNTGGGSRAAENAILQTNQKIINIMNQFKEYQSDHQLITLPSPNAESLTISSGDGRVIRTHTYEAPGDEVEYQNYQPKARALAILNADVFVPSGYKFELRRTKVGEKADINEYFVHLVPETEGFEFNVVIKAPEEEYINIACKDLVKKLFKAKIDAALEKGAVPLVRKN